MLHLHPKRLDAESVHACRYITNNTRHQGPLQFYRISQLSIFLPLRAVAGGSIPPPRHPTTSRKTNLPGVLELREGHRSERQTRRREEAPPATMAGWGPVSLENEIREQRHEEAQRPDGRSSLGTAEECCGERGERGYDAHIRGGGGAL